MKGPLPGVARLVLVALLCLATGGCAGGTASLRYTYPPGRTTTYRWTVDATTAVAGSPAHTLHLEAVVREQVLARVGTGGRLAVALEPGKALQDGRRIEPGPALEVDLDVGPDGQVTRVGQTPSLPSGALGSLGLDRLLAEAKPPLPARGVRLRDRWRADLATPAPAGGASAAALGAASTIDLTGTGRLDRFVLRDGRRIAGITIERQGRVATRLDGPGGSEPVTGTERDTTAAEFDLDRGVVVGATSRALTEVASASGPVRVELTTRVTLGG